MLHWNHKPPSCRWVLLLDFLVLGVLLMITVKCDSDKSISPSEIIDFATMCSGIKKIREISKMHELITKLKQFKNAHETSITKRVRSKLEPCVNKAESIISLEGIIEKKHGVCSSQHVDMIESYYNEYIKNFVTANSLVAKTKMLGQRRAMPLTMNFFSLYANQVSVHCKKHMRLSLSRIEKEGVVSKEDLDMASTWLTPTEAAECEYVPNRFASLNANQESSVGGSSGNRIKGGPEVSKKAKVKSCEIRSFLSNLSNINELALLIDSDKAALSFDLSSEGTHDATDNIPTRARINKDGDDDELFVVIPADRMKMMADISTVCLRFRPIYRETVMPVVRLALMGAAYEYKEFDEISATSPILKKWFGLTIVCETVLKSHLVKKGDKHHDSNGESYIVVDGQCEGTNDCAPFIAKQSDPNASLDVEEKTNRILSELYLESPIENNLWIHEYGPSKLSPNKTPLKKALYTLLRIDSKDHAKAVIKLGEVKRWLARGIITMIPTALSYLSG
jgi:hypothetical protein